MRQRARGEAAWIPRIAGVMVVLVTTGWAIRASRPITDPDTWWHLRLGEEFRSGWSLSNPQALSPFGTKPWFATQWTLEIVASSVEEWFGLGAVAWLAAVGVVVLSAVIYASCRERASTLAAAIATVVALAATSLSHAPRPQMASFVFVAVFTAAWVRTSCDLKPRWWLIPATWLWACTHGMWFIGPLVGLVVVIGLALEHRLVTTTAWRLISIPMGGILMAAVTPVGPKLLLAPFATSQMAEFVTEWGPPNFAEIAPALAALMVAVLVVTWARAGVRRSWPEVLLLAVAAGWILLSYRTIAVGAVIAAPLLADAVESWLPNPPVAESAWERRLRGLAAVFLIAALAVASPTRGASPLEEAVRLNRSLSGLPAGTVVYNDYALGGWLEWQHRNVVPVIDGLTDAYTVDYVGSYVDTVRLGPGWEDTLDRSGAEYALLTSESPLAVNLLDRNWLPMVRESGYVLLRRTSGAQ